MLFAALAFSRERELGTLEQLLVMPFSSLEIIIGKSIPVIIIGFTDFLLMLGMVNLAFGVPVRGSLPLLLIIAFGYILVELSKGMVISVFSRSQHQAFLLVLLVGMVDFMFTGYAAPVEGMPAMRQVLCQLHPGQPLAGDLTRRPDQRRRPVRHLAAYPGIGAPGHRHRSRLLAFHPQGTGLGDHHEP